LLSLPVRKIFLTLLPFNLIPNLAERKITMDETHNQIDIVLFDGNHLCEMLNKLLFFFSISNDEQIRDFDQHYQGHVSKWARVLN
jgi:hypothetical protein